MGVVLLDLTFDTLLVYLDDIIVFSKDFDEHCKKLDLVFTCLRENNLKLKPSKCFLFKERVRFLGHVMCKGGIQVDQEKVQVFGTWLYSMYWGSLTITTDLCPNLLKLQGPCMS